MRGPYTYSTHLTSVRVAYAGLIALAALLDACSGDIGMASEDEGRPWTGGFGRVEPLNCTGGPTLGPWGLRRLTRVEYNNTVRDLLGTKRAPADGFAEDGSSSVFRSNAKSGADVDAVKNYALAAEALAAESVQNLDALVPCDSTKAACAKTFVEEFGERAFRRPLTADEVQLFVDLHAAGDSPKQGFELVVRAMLQSPDFLYLVENEPTGAAPGTPIPLGDYEIASRLSYFLWRTMPDEALLVRAAAGELADPELLAAEANRMVDDPRTMDTILDFYGQLLEFEDLPRFTKTKETHPDFDSLKVSLLREARTFLEHVYRDGGSLATLLSAPYTFADQGVAELYGLAAPKEDFARVELDPTERAGLLTQGAFLAARAGPGHTSVPLRGAAVAQRLLKCEELQPASAVFQSSVEEDDRVVNPQCSACHKVIDPIGEVFEAFDAVGRADPEYVTEGMRAIPETDVERFSNVVELAHGLAGSGLVASCMTHQWVRYALADLESEADGCGVQEVVTAFDASGGNLRELLVGIVTSTMFRHRAAPTSDASPTTLDEEDAS